MALRALGFEYKKPEILKLLKENDKNNSNRIEFAEFNKLSKKTASGWGESCLIPHFSQ